MRLSIITVCYNSAATIEDSILSVLGQKEVDLEYIIVDGGSTDATMDVIDKYRPGIAKVISEPDEGLYDAMNKGLALATGDIIGILNSDDLYQDDRVLLDVVHAFTESPVDAVYGDLVYVDEQDLSKVKRYWKSGSYHRNSFLNGWMPPHPSFFVKKVCYDTFGHFDTSFRTSADYELMLRFLFKNHCTAVHLPRILVRMREGGQSNASWKHRLKANKEDRRAWTKNGLDPRIYTLTVKPFRKIGQFFGRPEEN